MMKRVVCAFALVVAGCSAMLPVVTQEDVRRAEGRWPGITREVLEKGREAYIDRCGSCHSLHLPSELNDAQWKRAVEEMQARAKVSPEEKEQILTYLLAQRDR